MTFRFFGTSPALSLLCGEYIFRQWMEVKSKGQYSDGFDLGLHEMSQHHTDKWMRNLATFLCNISHCVNDIE